MDRLVPLLMRLGRIDERDIVHGALCITARTSRNRNFQIESATGKRYFAKELVRDIERLGVRNESRIYQHVATCHECTKLRPWLPEFVAFDDASDTLLTSLLGDARDPLEFLRADTDYDLPAFGDKVGAGLAVLHSLRCEASPFLPNDLLPAGLSIHLPTVDILRTIFPSQLEILRQIQHDADACATLERLREGWTPQAPMHGDIKFANLVVAGASANDRQNRTGRPASWYTTPTSDEAISHLWLVDFELASLGEPAWDVGSVFQSYLWYAVHVVSQSDEVSAGAAPRALAKLLPDVQREVRTFWTSYVAHRALGESEQHALKIRATLMAGARLLQSSFEDAGAHDELPWLSSGCLQMGLNVLMQPERAARELLGIA